MAKTRAIHALEASVAENEGLRATVNALQQRLTVSQKARFEDQAKLIGNHTSVNPFSLASFLSIHLIIHPWPLSNQSYQSSSSLPSTACFKRYPKSRLRLCL